MIHVGAGSLGFCLIFSKYHRMQFTNCAIFGPAGALAVGAGLADAAAQ